MCFFLLRHTHTHVPMYSYYPFSLKQICHTLSLSVSRYITTPHQFLDAFLIIYRCTPLSCSCVPWSIHPGPRGWAFRVVSRTSLFHIVPRLMVSCSWFLILPEMCLEGTLLWVRLLDQGLAHPAKFPCTGLGCRSTNNVRCLFLHSLINRAWAKF